MVIEELDAVDLIHDFTEADRQKSLLEELIVSWLVHQVTFLKR